MGRYSGNSFIFYTTLLAWLFDISNHPFVFQLIIIQVFVPLCPNLCMRFILVPTHLKVPALRIQTGNFLGSYNIKTFTRQIVDKADFLRLYFELLSLQL